MQWHLLLVLSSGVIFFAVASSPIPPIPTVLDTDIGSDFDDTWALHYILSRPDLFDLQLVQVSNGNTAARAQITAKILSTLRRYDVPIGIGRPTSPAPPVPQYGYASNYTLIDWTNAGGRYYNGTDFLASLMTASETSQPTYVIAIGPMTSLGDVLQVFASNASRNTVVVAMSGSVYKGYGNSSTPSAEYNVVQDIPSAQRVYSSQWMSPMVTAPLDTTIFDQFCGDAYQTLLSANDTHHRFVQSLLENYQWWYDHGGKGSYGLVCSPFSPLTGTSTLYDLQAAYMASLYAKHNAVNDFRYFTAKALPLAVDNEGYTRITPGAQTVWATVGFPISSMVDVNAFAADVVSSLIVAT